MPFRPDEIADKEFLVGLRGYDKDEVRSFLRLVAEQVATAGTPIPAPPQAAVSAPSPTAPAATEWANLGDEIAAVLRTAHEQAAALRADAELEVRGQRQQAEAAGASTRAEAAAFAEATRAEAEQHRTTAAGDLVKAREQALGIVADAQARAETMLESSRVRAREEAEASVADLTGQINTLTETRDAVRIQLNDLRGRIEKAIGSSETTPG